jgi:hypothetical protein
LIARARHSPLSPGKLSTSVRHLTCHHSSQNAAKSDSLRLSTYCCTVVCAPLPTRTSCCPSATLSTAACRRARRVLTTSALQAQCSVVDRITSPHARLIAPLPTCATLHLVLPCWLWRRVTGAAADALSRLVSIGGTALALQLQLTSPLLQSFPAPNYYVSCRVSALLT